MDWLLSVFKEITGFLLPVLDSLSIIRAILGFTLMFFLPGFAWTLVFFNGKQINPVERAALSFGLSIAIVTLSILVLNRLFGVSITGFNAVLIILVITIIPVVIYYLKKRHVKSRIKRYYVYVLRSIKDAKFYTGCTTNLKRQLNEHNRRENQG